MTAQEEKIINDYLTEVVKNSSVCANCVYNHGNGMCFFASECIKHNFNLTKQFQCVTMCIESKE